MISISTQWLPALSNDWKFKSGRLASHYTSCEEAIDSRPDK